MSEHHQNDDMYNLLLQVKARFKQLEDEATHKASSAASREHKVGENKNGSVNPPDKPAVGDTIDDGTIYAGISPDTNEQMYAMPEDAPLRMN